MQSTYFANIFGIGVPELIIILVILVLLFGASKLPQLSRSIGSSMKELRKGMQDDGDEKSGEAKTSKPSSK